MPKMNYRPEERSEVIRQAYRGLFELAAPMLFDNYLDFIDDVDLQKLLAFHKPITHYS
jgi:hypothetical protein